MKILNKLLTLVMCLALTFIVASCGGPSGRPNGGGTTDDTSIGGSVDTTKQITLRIESAAPLRYNYNALLNSEEEISTRF